MSTPPPLPRITALTEPFWNAAREGRLILPKCRSCGQHFFRPESACTHCFATDWEWQPASGRGSLYSYSVIHRAPVPGLKVPVILAVVELSEGPMMYSNLVGLTQNEVKIGMPLEVCFEVASAEITLPKFRPLASSTVS